MSSLIKTQVVELREKFKKASDDDKVVILKELRSLNIDKTILKATSIGLVVNKHRKSDNAELCALVKVVVKAWKQVVMKEGGKSPGSKSPASPSGADKDPAKLLAQVSEESSKKKEEASLEGKAKANATTESPKMHLVEPECGAELNATGDSFRNKMQKLIHGVFKAGASENRSSVLAVKIEEEMCIKHKGSGTSYRDQMRLLLSNLRDPASDLLRTNIVDGVIPAKELVQKDVSDLANPELLAARAKEHLEGIEAARTDWNAPVKEGEEEVGWNKMFECPACGLFKSKYYQKQIRGADEPMTVFIMCYCGHRWQDGSH